MSRRSARRLLIVGDSAGARRLYESFQQLAPADWHWLGVVADTSTDIGLGVTLGNTRDLGEIIAGHHPTDVVTTGQLGLTLTKIVLQLPESGVRVVDVRSMHEELTHRVAVLGDEEVWVTMLKKLSCPRGPSGVAKRVLDLVAAVCAVIVLAMVFVPVALALKLSGAGSVFVVEQRIGRRGRPFKVLRFRTARAGPESAQWPFVDPPAPTPIGSIIRRAGIDRLPQAFSILAGDLSLVGPRAAVLESAQRMERESPVFLLRTVVKPGLLGWEQLHRESRTFYDALRVLEYDLYYVKHQSFGLDLRILVYSALALLGRPPQS